MKLSGLLLPLVTVLALGGCGGAEPAGPVTLELVVQDWSGWQREQPPPQKRTLVVEEGDRFTVEAIGGDITVSVVEIDGEEIDLKTSDDLAPRAEGEGIDLDGPTSEFTLERAGSVRFSTPTLDAGTTVTLTEREGR